jgi:hypothetical protein
MDRRFFSVREANELIPFLTAQLEQIRSERTRLARACDGMPDLQEIMLRGGMPVSFQYFECVRRVHGLLAEIGATGCQIKDLETGLIDFPTIWEGREVLLCWKMGETEVSFWHELDTGFAGRQPLKSD